MYGYHACLSVCTHDTEPKFKQYRHKIVSSGNSFILKLPYTIIRKMCRRCKSFQRIVEREAKILPDCDFSCFMTFNKELTTRQLICKFKRAVSHQITLNRDLTYKAMLLRIIKEKGDPNAENISNEFFEEDFNIKPLSLPTKSYRNIESKLFNMLTDSHILEDIEQIAAFTNF